VNSGRASRLALASPMRHWSSGPRVSGGREEMAEQGGKDDD
jgi:hypothetical protein